MSLITLNNGRTVNIPAERYYFMSDAELEELLNSNEGDDIENPWYASALDNAKQKGTSNRDLTEITPDEKLSDPEFNVPE